MFTPPPVQTTYTQYMTKAQNGMIASMSGWDIDTRVLDDPTGAGVGFGVAVSQGSVHGDRTVVLGNLSGSNFVGITAADPTLANLDTGPTGSAPYTDKYADTENTNVLVRGDIWVVTGGAVNPELEVYYNNTTGVLSATATGATAIPAARWLTSATAAGQFAAVRLGHAAGNVP